MVKHLHLSIFTCAITILNFCAAASFDATMPEFSLSAKGSPDFGFYFAPHATDPGCFVWQFSGISGTGSVDSLYTFESIGQYTSNILPILPTAGNCTVDFPTGNNALVVSNPSGLQYCDIGNAQATHTSTSFSGVLCYPEISLALPFLLGMNMLNNEESSNAYQNYTFRRYNASAVSLNAQVETYNTNKNSILAFDFLDKLQSWSFQGLSSTCETNYIAGIGFTVSGPMNECFNFDAIFSF